MQSVVQLVGPDRTVQIFDVRLVGVNARNAERVLFTLVVLLLLWAIARAVRWLALRLLGDPKDVRARFVMGQTVQIVTGLLLILALVSIWFSNPTRLANAIAFAVAGLAIALQRVVTAVAGYFVILRGGLFDLGDRITLGGVRGDVIGLGWVRTTIMEMGQPPAVQQASPAMWVEGRQYTGRIVTITNDKVFSEPVYNYTHEFPYLWEEMHLPIAYETDRRAAERILLDVAARHATPLSHLSEGEVREMQRRYFIAAVDFEPRVFVRLTSNWLELALRFVCRAHGVRALKDRMSREILDRLDEAGIGVASGTYAVVAMPQLRVKLEQAGGD